MKPNFFASTEAFRLWLEEHHQSESELLVGYYRVATGKPSMSWSESVDEALCFGWIDGIRRRIDDERYTIRFTPRRPKSHWSRINLDKVIVLKRAGRMMPAGLAAFEERNRSRSQRYSFEQDSVALDPEYKRAFSEQKAAWRWFRKLAPGYRKQSVWWVMSAKKETTRRRRLGILIESSAAGRKIPPLGE